MVSKMMLEDAEDLAKRGISLTPREVVRLNALGLAVERGTLATSIFTLPRACIIGDITFREPTIGHEVWLDEVARVYDMSDGMTAFAVTALCYATQNHEDLPKWESREDMLDSVSSFVRTRLAGHTIREVVSAVRYVRDGSSAEDGEEGPERIADDEGEDSHTDWSSSLGVVHEGQSIGLGISLADSMHMTRSALRGVISRAYSAKGFNFSKGEKETAIGDYNKVLDEIVKSHEVKSNG